MAPQPHRPDRLVRLALVSDAVLPWNQGGKEQRHHELATRLARRGFAVTVYTMHWWDGPRRLERDGITYVALCRHRPIYHGQRRSIVQALVFALSCLKLLWHRFDVVEADAIPFLPLPPVRLVCWLRRRPMVTTWHEFWGRDYWVAYLGGRGRLAAYVERTAVRLPDRVIACSEETAARLRDTPHGPRDVVVVPNGVATASLPDEHAPATAPAPAAPAPRDRQGPNDFVRDEIRGESAQVRPAQDRQEPNHFVLDDPAHGFVLDDPARGRPGPARLLVAGRLLENKRVDLGLRAVRVLLDRGADVTFEVVGNGPERDGLVALAAELELGDRVTFTDFLPSHEDVLAAMAGADVLLFTSTREGFGMVALEAMSVGTPVVTADHPDNAARHLVRDGWNGYVAEVSPEGFAAAVEATLAELPVLEEGARATAADYDWEQLADRAAAAYRGVLPG